MKLRDVGGLTQPEKTLLTGAGISTAGLAAAAGDSRAVNLIAGRTGIPAGRVAELASTADLQRVNGIGPGWAATIAETGTASTAELGEAEPAGLWRALNRARKSGVSPPNVECLREWIDTAKELESS